MGPWGWLHMCPGEFFLPCRRLYAVNVYQDEMNIGWNCALKQEDMQARWLSLLNHKILIHYSPLFVLKIGCTIMNYTVCWIWSRILQENYQSHCYYFRLCSQLLYLNLWETFLWNYIHLWDLLCDYQYRQLPFRRTSKSDKSAQCNSVKKKVADSKIRCG